MKSSTQIITSLFENKNAAAAAATSLLRTAFSADSISLFFREDDITIPKLLSTLNYVRYFDIPKAGRFISAGPLAAHLSNWALGGYRDSLDLTLEDFGLETELVKSYCEVLGSESTLLLVQHSNPQTLTDAVEILRNAGAYNISSTSLADLSLEDNLFGASLGGQLEGTGRSYRPII